MKYGCIALALACASVTTANASGAVLRVTNNGSDVPGCGGDGNPCRSITAGIAAAAAGDTILVGPGKYGDIDGDNSLGGPGEEIGNTGVLHINKAVIVISTNGAGATVIRGVSGLPIVVYISADGAQFGDRNAGFTVYGANSFGVSDGTISSGKVIGNIARGMAAGFYLQSMGSLEASYNIAIDNFAIGIAGVSANDSTGAVNIHNNTIIGPGGGTGIVLGGLGAHRAIANTVSGNDIGVQVSPSPSRIAQNLIVDNRLGVAYPEYLGPGAPAGTPTVTRNSLNGNSGNALWVSPNANYTITFRQNNLIGNDYCAVQNGSPLTIDARQNFWGSPAGPGFGSGPCNYGAGQILTTPFAISEIDIR
jgi:hypothetical protein